MRVRVERIGRGRRVAEVEYLETRSPRRPPAERRESNPFEDHSMQLEQAHGKLRLPWQINRRAE